MKAALAAEQEYGGGTGPALGHTGAHDYGHTGRHEYSPDPSSVDQVGRPGVDTRPGIDTRKGTLDR
jgi:hypothetical protein